MQQFRTVELNAGYSRWPSDRTFAGWQLRLPLSFRLSVKAPGLVTHVRRLYGPERWATRIGAAFRVLGDRAGVRWCNLRRMWPLIPPGSTTSLVVCPAMCRSRWSYAITVGITMRRLRYWIAMVQPIV